MVNVLFITSVFTSFVESIRSYVTPIALSLLVTGCAGLQQDVLVTLPKYQTNLADQKVYSGFSAKIYVSPIKDVRKDILGDLIGERKSFNTSLGDIEMSPIPANMLEQLLKSELSALGNKIVDSDEEFRVEGQLNKFKIVTPNTISYWDINGEIDITLAIVGQAGEVHNSHYTATCTDRTFVWPSEGIIKDVVTDCLGKVATSLQNDTALARFLSGK